ncbi:hypothetical protein ROJ8625_01941 [Roseivivax jejudonensis]|uniref:Uncharacterized protein n=1 Tax=Roseivivax jejudonensis TaxID=1529041 RepID=A0A1X6Z5H1_9RHOB|nr:hypothetical protein [Roseivivax jejudonensis]SLN40985.1 hypothetical protein ROJ8625_01941 [Roseivivax jejudonensis]
MDAAFIVPVLALITLLAGTVYALWSKHVTEQAKADPAHPKSRLAADTPSR